MLSKQHLPLIVALALPLVFIAGVLFFTLPQQSVSTSHDLLFARCPQQSAMWRPCALNADAIYVVEGVKDVAPFRVSARKVKPQVVAAGEKPLDFIEPVVVRYNPTTGIVTTVDKAEVAALRVVSKDTSPDGVRVEFRYGRGGDFFPFVGGSGRKNGWYLVAGKQTQRIDNETLGLEEYAGTDRIEFLGWAVR